MSENQERVVYKEPGKMELKDVKSYRDQRSLGLRGLPRTYQLGDEHSYHG